VRVLRVQRLRFLQRPGNLLTSAMAFPLLSAPVRKGKLCETVAGTLHVEKQLLRIVTEATFSTQTSQKCDSLLGSGLA
jgi:hypothetical protein